MYSYGPLHMAKQKQDDQLEPTYSCSVWIQGIALMSDREGWRERVRDIRADGMIRWWNSNTWKDLTVYLQIINS